ncbi:MAG: class I SAM-dependent methyltransferase [Gammaproteobacteria bacterium]|nr:class I SAM-dependent methyltransferase [Gammaproteobacteria bacterium]
MQIAANLSPPITSDFDLISRLLPTRGTRLLELGCGAAFTTRMLAESLPVKEIIAMEVDEIQHQKNLLIPDLPNVTFAFGGAESIDLPDASVDAVIMLKSLHHVPLTALDAALAEIARVLRPSGLAYISEPVYDGDFNAILRLFNDEKVVRQAAFDAVRRAVDTGLFELADEIHFGSVSRFNGFAEFESRILGATHSTFDVDEALHARVRAAFMPHVTRDGIAEFVNPMRVDLLRKPA